MKISITLCLLTSLITNPCWANDTNQRNSTTPPLGLPSLVTPDDNPLTPAKVKLGKKLFFDRRLSFNDTLSCAMCHIPEQGFSNNFMATSVGISRQAGKRNSPSLYNVAYMLSLFHDGRAGSLEDQVWGPLLADIEMGNPTASYVIDKLANLSDYDGLFKQAFNRKISKQTIGMALSSYQRTLTSANSPFDRWYYGNRQQALSEQAKLGFKIFTGKGHCSSCHLINQKYALFTDNKFHNTGFGYQHTMSGLPLAHNITVAPGGTKKIGSSQITAVVFNETEDYGRFETTQKPSDRWKFKTPTLRNIALTRPYMHNGQISNLEQVVAFYNQGGSADPGQSPLIKPLNLDAEEIEALISFLYSLTGDNIDELSQSR